MLDLGNSFVASVARDPHALAIVDAVPADLCAMVSAYLRGRRRLRPLGLKPGDHLVTVLQNCWAAATMHWACQFAGIMITPINWRAKADEIDFCIEDSEAKAVVFQDVSAAEAVARSGAAQICRASRSTGRCGDEILFRAMIEPAPRRDAARRRRSLVDHALYLGHDREAEGRAAAASRRARRRRSRMSRKTCTARRAHARRHAALSYHGRALADRDVADRRRLRLPAALRGGQGARADRGASGSPTSIWCRRSITIWFTPRAFRQDRCASVRKLGFAGAPMTDGLLKKLDAAFRPDLFVNHYGSSEIYTFTIDQNAPAKPGSAGKAGINQRIRVVKLGAATRTTLPPPDEEGEIIALLAGDEAFEGYWRRPDADAKALRRRLVFHRRYRLSRWRWRSLRHRPRRRHDHHRRRECFAGRDRELPLAASGRARGRRRRPARRKLGQGRHGLRQAQGARSSGTNSISFAARRGLPISSARGASSLSTHIPKSPVGKLLRRMLVAGEFETEHARPNEERHT